MSLSRRIRRKIAPPEHRRLELARYRVPLLDRSIGESLFPEFERSTRLDSIDVSGATKEQFDRLMAALSHADMSGSGIVFGTSAYEEFRAAVNAIGKTRLPSLEEEHGKA